jgi:hypothetical protein
MLHSKHQNRDCACFGSEEGGGYLLADGISERPVFIVASTVSEPLGSSRLLEAYYEAHH